LDGYGAVVSDFLNKAREAVGGVPHDPLLDRTDDVVEDGAEGGTNGAIADQADDAIDQIQGTKD
jgi:hypothetical protein